MPLVHTNLRKWSTTIIKDKSTQDAAQIPATTVGIDVYWRGATVNAGSPVVIPPSGTATIFVYDRGDIETDCTVQVGTDDTQNLTVTVVNSRTQMDVRNDGSSSVVLSWRDRLVVTGDADGNRPLLYGDSAGTSQISGDSHVDTDARGYAEFYTFLPAFDYIITNGSVKSLVVDEESGPWPPEVNVMSYATFQDAIDALPTAGGTVLIPAGHYDRTTIPAVVPMTITNRVHLKGEVTCNTSQTGGTFLSYRINSPGNEDLTSDLITIIGHAADGTTIEHIGFEGADTAGDGVGVHFAEVSDLVIKDCYFQSFPSWCMQTGDGGDTVDCIFDHVTFAHSRRDGLVQLSRGTSLNFYHKFINCNFQPSKGRGIDIGSSEFLVFDSCVFQSGAPDADVQELINLAPATTASLFKVVIRNCWLENLSGAVTPTNWMIRLVGNTIGTVIDSCIFSRTATGTTSLKAIKYEDYTTLGPKGTMISNNLGDLGLVNIKAGTDDVLISSNSASTVVMNNILSDNADYGGFWRVSGMKSADIRIDGLRNKLPSASTQAQLDAITDPVRGDIVLNNANDVPNWRSASGFWRAAATHLFTGAGKRPGEAGATPTGGKFQVGDTAYNQTDDIFGICTVAGTSGTWRKITTAAW